MISSDLRSRLQVILAVSPILQRIIITRVIYEVLLTPVSKNEAVHPSRETGSTKTFLMERSI
ncbi:MAG: hypothetical protein LUP97_02835, partial [Methanoregula sp.]|nr:hypothetical protein [Methanoregula sp.]